MQQVYQKDSRGISLGGKACRRKALLEGEWAYEHEARRRQDQQYIVRRYVSRRQKASIIFSGGSDLSFGARDGMAAPNSGAAALLRRGGSARRRAMRLVLRGIASGTGNGMHGGGGGASALGGRTIDAHFTAQAALGLVPGGAGALHAAAGGAARLLLGLAD